MRARDIVVSLLLTRRRRRALNGCWDVRWQIYCSGVCVLMCACESERERERERESVTTMYAYMCIFFIGIKPFNDTCTHSHTNIHTCGHTHKHTHVCSTQRNTTYTVVLHISKYTCMHTFNALSFATWLLADLKAWLYIIISFSWEMVTAWPLYDLWNK